MMDEIGILPENKDKAIYGNPNLSKILINILLVEYIVSLLESGAVKRTSFVLILGNIAIMAGIFILSFTSIDTKEEEEKCRKKINEIAGMYENK